MAIKCLGANKRRAYDCNLLEADVNVGLWLGSNLFGLAKSTASCWTWLQPNSACGTKVGPISTENLMGGIQVGVSQRV